MDLRCGCGGDASVNADAIDDDDYNDNSGDGNGNNGNGGRDLALALTQLHPHPRNGEGNRDASPPLWRLALDVETFDGLARSANLMHGRVPLRVAVRWATQTRASPSPTWAAPSFSGLVLGLRPCRLELRSRRLGQRPYGLGCALADLAAPSWRRYAQYALAG